MHTSSQMVHLLHGQVLPRAVEVVPGVFMGGDAGASDAVSKGLATPEQFKFFAGAVVWDEGQLQMEVDMGVWWVRGPPGGRGGRGGWGGVRGGPGWMVYV